MAARGVRERCGAEEGRSGGARADADLLLHPELLSQEFLLLTLEQVRRKKLQNEFAKRCLRFGSFTSGLDTKEEEKVVKTLSRMTRRSAVQAPSASRQNESLSSVPVPGSLAVRKQDIASRQIGTALMGKKNIPVEDEVKISKDGLTDLYVQHVIPLPQRDIPKTRWGKLMEKKRTPQTLKQHIKSIGTVENLRKRPLIVFDGSSTSTSIKVKKTENGADEAIKHLTAGNTGTTCRRLSIPSNSSACRSASNLSLDFKVESRDNEVKQNNVIVSHSVTSTQKSSQLVPVTGTTVVKLKRAAPKEESDSSNDLKPTESKKKIQHVTWP